MPTARLPAAPACPTSVLHLPGLRRPALGDLDPLPLHLLLLWEPQGHLQDAVREAGGGVLQVHVVGQRDEAPERAIPPLRPPHATLLGLLLLLPLALDQQALVQHLDP